MPDYGKQLLTAAALVVIAPLVIWLGQALGRKAARAAPGMAAALWFFSVFFRIDPPPPPTAERVHKDEEDAAAPPEPER